MIHSARILICVLGLGLMATPALAQEQAGADPLADARVASVRHALEDMARRADAAGLPSAWLRDKVAEGLAKHAPPARIAQAVDALLARMVTADGIEERLRLPTEDSSRRLLRALVDASSAGISDAALEQLVQHVSRASHSRSVVRQAAVTVAELAERRVASAVALEMTTRAFDSQGRDGLAALRRAARHSNPNELEAAMRRAASGQRGGAPIDHGMGHTTGPPHDNAFGQGRGRSAGAGMRP